MKLKYIIYLLFILAACSEKEKKKENGKENGKEKSNLVVGKWEFEKIERYNGEPINLQDSGFNALHQQHIGLTFSFTKDYVFKVTQRKGGTEEFIAEQPYELPEEYKTLRLKNQGRPDDNFPIISVSDSLLKINVFNSPVAYVVFRKKT